MPNTPTKKPELPTDPKKRSLIIQAQRVERRLRAIEAAMGTGSGRSATSIFREHRQGMDELRKIEMKLRGEDPDEKKKKDEPPPEPEREEESEYVVKKGNPGHLPAGHPVGGGKFASMPEMRDGKPDNLDTGNVTQPRHVRPGVQVRAKLSDGRRLNGKVMLIGGNWIKVDFGNSQMTLDSIADVWHARNSNLTMSLATRMKRPQD